MTSENQFCCPNCGSTNASDGLCGACAMRLGRFSGREADMLEATRSRFGQRSQTDEPALSAADLGEKFPQYEILNLIGRGGMGTVYRARQKSLDRMVAIKIINENDDNPAFAERFSREARALARLSHPNIVTIHDFGHSENLFFLVMEYIDGVNLRQAIDAKAFDPGDALRVIEQVCSALQFAHGRGVVHRDIKPENILLTEDGTAKIADFGLAKLMGDRREQVTLTSTRQVMGTLAYMAPEQIDNSANVDHRADIYSLGVVFYELLTGNLPLGRFELPSERAAGVDRRIDPVVMKTLSRAPDKRYQAASDLGSEVSRLQIQPVAPNKPDAKEDEPFVRPAVAAIPGKKPVLANDENIAFWIDEWGGFATGEGLMTLDDHQIIFRWRVKDALFGVVKSETKTLVLPTDEISRMVIANYPLLPKLRITVKSLDRLDPMPQKEFGMLSLSIARMDCGAANRWINRYETLGILKPGLQTSIPSLLTSVIPGFFEMGGEGHRRLVQSLIWFSAIVFLLFVLLQVSLRPPVLEPEIPTDHPVPAVKPY